MPLGWHLILVFGCFGSQKNNCQQMYSVYVSIYRTHVRINISRTLTSVIYKPRKIKEMLPNVKEKLTKEYFLKNYAPRSILTRLRYSV